MRKEAVKNYWNDVANNDGPSEGVDVGTLHRGNYLQAHYRRKKEEKFIDNFLSMHSKKLNILEIGTGGGRWAVYLSKYGHDIFALDISEKMIELAKANAEKLHANSIEFAAVDPFDHLQACEVRYDLIYFSGMLMYLNDDEVSNLLTHAKSKLKKNGLLLARETLVHKKRLATEGEYPAIYRTKPEYDLLADKASLRLDHVENAYEKMRFSRIISRLGIHKIFGFTVANTIRSLILCAVKLIGDPAWLKHKQTLMDDKMYGEKEHFFMVFK